MPDAAIAQQKIMPGIKLTDQQLTGLGKIGETANQVTELLQAFQTVLEDLRDGIDIDAIADRIGPELEALIQTFREINHLLKIGSVQDLQKQVHKGIKVIEESHVIDASPELIMLVGSLHDSGLLKLLPSLLSGLKTITDDVDAERLGERIASFNQSLSYWIETAREGFRIAGDQLEELNIPDRVANLEELADQWWRIAMRAKQLAQGNADTLGDRIEWLLNYAERLSAQIAPVASAIGELAPEAIQSIDFSVVGTKITQGALEWIEIGMNAHAFVKGDSETLAMRVRLMLEGAREAGLDKMVPDLMGLVGTVQRTGLIRKLNQVLNILEPHLPADEELKKWLEQGVALSQRYQPQLTGAVPALDGAIKAMEGSETKRGGLLGLLSIVFSRKTQYVLRFAIEFAYRFLHGSK